MESSIPGFTVGPVPRTLGGVRSIMDILNSIPRFQESETSDSDEAQELIQILDRANSYLLVTEEASGKSVAYIGLRHHRRKTREEDVKRQEPQNVEYAMKCLYSLRDPIVSKFVRKPPGLYE